KYFFLMLNDGQIDLLYYDLFGSLYLVLLNGSKLPSKQEECSSCTLIAENFAMISPQILAGQGFSRLLCTKAKVLAIRNTLEPSRQCVGFGTWQQLFEKDLRKLEDQKSTKTAERSTLFKEQQRQYAAIAKENEGLSIQRRSRILS
ncbi:hypothetical protein J1N35_000552, partial [Gossypium stocksii]